MTPSISSKKRIEEMETEISELKKEINDLKKGEFTFDNKQIDCKILTGITLFLFTSILSRFKVPMFKTVSNKFALFLTLYYMRHGDSKLVVSILFNISKSFTGKIIKTTLKYLCVILKDCVYWPDRNLVQHNNSCSNKWKLFKDVISLIDCFEVKTQRPLNLNNRAQFWSHYKHHSTTKFLISVTPQGAISFISEGWGGRVSDKEIFLKSRYCSNLKRGDAIAMDRGFLVKVECNLMGVKCHLPDFTKGRRQLTHLEVIRSKKLAQLRIHVERVIGLMRNFKILTNVFPLKCKDEIDNIVFIVCALVNLRKPIVS